MTREEIVTLLEECKAFWSIHKNMYEDDKIRLEWFRILKHYDKADIYASLERHKEGAYNRQPIVLNDLVRNLRTIMEKQNSDLGSVKVACPICNRYIAYSEYEKHTDRCRSTEYVLAQYSKWFHKELTASYLWSLPDYEFDEKYDKLLHYIQENTSNENEKTIIGYIFNPPNEEETKEFFGTKNNT